MNTARLRSTLGAIVAFIIAFGPDIVTWIGGLETAPQWLRGVSKGLGVLIGILTSKDGVLLLNKLVATPPATSSGISTKTGVGQGGFATIPAMVAGFFFAAAGTLILCLTLGGCHNVTPDQFFGATVDCAKQNPEASAALAQAETCLVAVVSQNPSACLAGLVTDVHFTVDEVACVVAYIAQLNQAKVATGKYTDDDLRARQAANDFLAKEHISIRNTYKGQ
jgi:hypothetical protein